MDQRGRAAVILGLLVAALAGLVVVASFPSLIPWPQEQWTYIRGTGTASDGRISITLDGYYFTEARNIGFQHPILPTEIFLIANVTMANVGGGDTLVGGGDVRVLNGTEEIGNGNYYDNASLPGRFPFPVYPSPTGGVLLHPGQRASGWLAFYISGPTYRDIPRLRFVEFDYREFHYGGQCYSDGLCTGGNRLMIWFIITPP